MVVRLEVATAAEQAEMHDQTSSESRDRSVRHANRHPDEQARWCADTWRRSTVHLEPEESRMLRHEFEIVRLAHADHLPRRAWNLRTHRQRRAVLGNRPPAYDRHASAVRRRAILPRRERDGRCRSLGTEVENSKSRYAADVQHHRIRTGLTVDLERVRRIESLTLEEEDMVIRRCSRARIPHYQRPFQA